MNYLFTTGKKMSKLIKTIQLILLFIGMLSFQISAQTNKGTIKGKVIDAESGEPIIGANVLLKGTTTGAASDIEGNYVIENVPSGKYELIVSYISFAKTRIPNIIIKGGEVVIQNVALKPEAVAVDEVVVTSKADESYEAALLNKQKKSVSISDGISAEQIKRSPDATSSDALKRVTGISVVDNKFIFVRGTSERYSNALLNNSPLSSTEPDKKSFAFDLIPSNLLANTVIDKSYTPDKPGDFAGGLVNLNTIDFPDKLKLNITIDGSFMNNTSLSDFKTYNGGKLDFLGIDDGTRSLPSSIPSDLSKGNYSPEEMLEFAKSLPNNWSSYSKKAPLNGGFMISVGDGVSLFGPRFGFIAAISYKNNFSKTNLERNEYEASGETRFNYAGQQYKYSTLWGGLLNLSYKLGDNHKFSFKNTYSHTSDDEVSELQGMQYTDSGTEQIQNAIRFTSRQVYNSQLSGEHYFGKSFQTQWRLYNSISKRDEPDYRRVIYAREIGSNDNFAALLGFQVNLKNGGRFYSNLDESTTGFATDFSMPFDKLKFKFGGLYENKDREFRSRLIGTIINAPGNGFTDFRLLYLPIDQIFSPENYRRNGFSIQEYLNGTNNYNAGQTISAFYLMFEYGFNFYGNELKFIGGARLENSKQTVKSRDLSDQKDILIEHKNNDILPSLNLIYQLSESSNLRFSVSQTVNRPELRELAPFAYFDFYTQTSIRGNSELKRAVINNYDFRYESYFGIGEMISASLFYKDIKDAIEQVVVSGSALGSERTYRNSDNAKVYGLELEGRFGLGRITGLLSNFFINGNYTRIQSSVTVEGTETTIARNGRPLQGQSPYTINIGLSYNSEDLGTSITFLYNRIGERIIEVATAYQEDIVEEPRDVIDFVINKKLTDNLSLKFAAKDLLGRDQIFRQGDKKARLNSRESAVSISISYKI